MSGLSKKSTAMSYDEVLRSKPKFISTTGLLTNQRPVENVALADVITKQKQEFVYSPSEHLEPVASSSTGPSTSTVVYEQSTPPAEDYDIEMPEVSTISLSEKRVRSRFSKTTSYRPDIPKPRPKSPIRTTNPIPVRIDQGTPAHSSNVPVSVDGPDTTSPPICLPKVPSTVLNCWKIGYTGPQESTASSGQDNRGPSRKRPYPFNSEMKTTSSFKFTTDFTITVSGSGSKRLVTQCPNQEKPMEVNKVQDTAKPRSPDKVEIIAGDDDDDDDDIIILEEVMDEEAFGMSTPGPVRKGHSENPFVNLFV